MMVSIINYNLYRADDDQNNFQGNELTHARSRRTQPTSPNNGMTTGPNMFSQRTEQNLRNLASSPTTTVAAQNSTLDNASSQAITIENINSYLTNYCINHLTSLTISAFILLSLGNHVPSIYLFIMLWIIDVISLCVVCKYREREYNTDISLVISDMK